MTVETVPQTSVDELAVNTIRTLAIDAVENANSGHPGAPMGLAPLGYVLWTRVMRHNPANPQWPDRDRFVLSNGHASMLQYALLHLCGYDLTLDDIRNFRQLGSRTPGHPEYGDTAGVEVTTGPLGQGFSNAVGFALAREMLAQRFNTAERKIVDHDVWMICSDGDLQEGISSEAASFGGNLGLGRLIAIYDDNHVQLDGPTAMAFDENVAERFDAYGWFVQELELEPGLDQIEQALRDAREVTDRPSLIVHRTHIGYGSPNKQDKSSSHGSPLGEDEVKLTKENLGWPTLEPFYIPDEAREAFAGVRERGAEAEAEWSQLFEAYARDDPERAQEFERMAQRRPPALPPLSEAPKREAGSDPIATRAASGEAINWLAASVPELIGGSADLSTSTSTDIKGSDLVARHSFGGRNIRFGVREHAMGAIVNGLVLSGFRAFSGTFLTFSDYMRTPIRLGALMDIPAIYLFTHDSILMGEDGPTHQPIEHLAALRAVPNLDVIRPADYRETFLAWHWVAGKASGPSVLVLTRQKLPVLDPAAIPDDAIERGAYVHRDPYSEADLILIGTGSELALCLDAADLLAEDGIRTRVVSMPSVDRFAAQPEDYRDSVLPPAITARLSVEAATPLGWRRWVGDRGDSVAMTTFGASAPGPLVAEHFGFTPANVAAKAKAVLER
jgi:transketolase